MESFLESVTLKNQSLIRSNQVLFIKKQTFCLDQKQHRDQYE